MDIDPQRILISTQGPNREPYKSEIEFLFKSLNQYGGKLVNSQKIACFTERPDSLLTQKLQKLGVKIKIVDVIDERHPPSNKIQMLSLYKNEDFDVLVALDSDIVVVDDFSKYIDLENFSAKPVDDDPFSMKNWETIYNFFGVQFPKERYFTSFHNLETIPYFNSGVLIIPRNYLSDLYDLWQSFAKKLLNSYDEMPEIKKNEFFTDQIALSLAVTELKIPKRPLPLEMNFPTNYKVHESFKPGEITPYLIHYHHFSESGKIKNCAYEIINRIIEKINETIIQENNSRDNFPLNDIQEDKLKFVLDSTTDPDLLLELVNLSRKKFGWFTKHLPRAYEYPWLINQINEFRNKIFLDIGAGVSPLPIYLAEKGSNVFTVDSYPIIRNINENPSDWNEWGFFDYSTINKNIKSINSGIETVSFPENYFDCIYSVSVIEHIKASARREIWEKISKWIKTGGNLLFTVDLYTNKDTLWNFSEGKEVEDISIHGNLSILKEEIQNYGFQISKCEFLRNIPDSRIDCAFISFRKI